MLARSAFRSRHRNVPRPAYKSAPGFLKWLRGRPCLFMDKGGCEGRIVAAHVDYAGDKGIGTKVADRHAVPMCDGHHGMQHSLGWKTFEARMGVSCLKAAQEYWAAWPGRYEWEKRNG